MAGRLVAIALALAFAGCYSPDLPECAVHCNSDSPCPADLTCGDDHHCHAAGDTQMCNTALLTVIANGSGGHVSSNPDGIDCSTDDAGSAGCEAMFQFGSMITLTEMDFGGDGFGGWHGDECDGSENDTCTFHMMMPTTITAQF